MKEPDIVIKSIYGACPVQAEGTVDGFPFYFRARWNHWELCVGATEDADPPEPGDWEYGEDWGDEFDASYTPEDTAREFIIKAARIWAQEKGASFPGVR